MKFYIISFIWGHISTSVVFYLSSIWIICSLELYPFSWVLVILIHLKIFIEWWEMHRIIYRGSKREMSPPEITFLLAFNWNWGRSSWLRKWDEIPGFWPLLLGCKSSGDSDLPQVSLQNMNSHVNVPAQWPEALRISASVPSFCSVSGTYDSPQFRIRNMPWWTKPDYNICLICFWLLLLSNFASGSPAFLYYVPISNSLLLWVYAAFTVVLESKIGLIQTTLS